METGLGYIMVNGRKLQHLIRDHCTSQNMGWRYINSDRMKVHHRKQENGTSLKTGFSYITLRYITSRFLGFLDVVVTWPSIATLSLVQMALADSRLTRGRTVDCDYDPLVGSQSYEFVCTHPQRFRWRRWWGWDTKIHHTLVQQHKAHIHPTSHQWCTLVWCS